MSESSRLRVGIVGASGYGGGEVLRLLTDHPDVTVTQITSRSKAGHMAHTSHPNLRNRCKLQFMSPSQLEPCDLLFLCLPHGEAAKSIDRYAALAPRIIDLSADFRLKTPDVYQAHYGEPHPAPQWLGKFVYGLPELHRDELRSATHVSGIGCNATAMNLALLALARRNLIQRAICDIKVGSSEAGNAVNEGSHHPERAGAVRTYAPVSHRHVAEVRQELFNASVPFDIHVTVTAIELVRGVLCTAHVFPNRPVTERELWSMLRESFGDEPFVRIVKDRAGLYRLPEPKILAGSNFADIGFAVEENGGRIVMISAIDNLMKGAAGSAVQCMNLMCGFEETRGLTFPGLHPI